MNALSTNLPLNDKISHIELNDCIDQDKKLKNLKVSITLTLTDLIIKAKPTKQFITWLSSNPTLSFRDIYVIENFYDEKTVGHQLIDIKHYKKYIDNYNKYKNYLLNNNNEFIWLDEFFVDETCVWFLVYRKINNKYSIQSFEILLDTYN
jgi:hypothetical protein